MVSNKTIIILITIAIILSIISVAVTFSSVSTGMIPKVSPPNINVKTIPVEKSTQVGLVVYTPPTK